MHTGMLRTMHELHMALAAAGIVYTPPQEGDIDGNFVFQAAYDAALAYSKPRPDHPADAMRGMEFGPEIPGGIDGKELYMVVIDSDMSIEDVFKLTTAQIVDRVASYIAGNYWAQAACSYGEEI